MTANKGFKLGEITFIFYLHSFITSKIESQVEHTALWDTVFNKYNIVLWLHTAHFGKDTIKSR